MITEVTIGGLTILLGLSKETRGEEIEMIKKSIPLSKITSLLMKKERKKSLALKFIILETPPHFPI